MASESSEFKQPIHFFKIMLTQILHQEKLMIPRKFVSKYGGCLPKAICLKTPNGAYWKLSLVKSDGKIWFEKGWKEFEEYHSLSHGDLLVFKYETTSHFEVQIFDMTATEITYPFKRVEANNKEDYRASQKRQAYSSFEIGSTSSVKDGKSQKVAAVHHTNKKRKGKLVNITLTRAKSFRTCNPSFVVVMRASYVERYFQLCIPSVFGMRHFDTDKKRGYIYFQVSNNENVWPAKYLIKMGSATLKFQVSSATWKKFSKDNNLKVGDVCNFELILSTTMTFLVHIFRASDKDNTDCSTSQCRIN
ncbi:unnamed protein product [Lathyrus sativus]|nr:unnamed protein product [Lathyrus sativus]